MESTRKRWTPILSEFAAEIPAHYSDEDRDRGGYIGEDRRGNKVFYPVISLSAGAVKVRPGQFASHYQVATAAAEAKKEAKKIQGNSLFIERRQEAS